MVWEEEYQGETPVLKMILEEVTPLDKYCLVLVFEAKALQLSDFERRQAKFASFFGPGITAEVVKGENNLYEVWLISNADANASSSTKPVLGKYYREPKKSSPLLFQLIGDLVRRLKKDHYVIESIRLGMWCTTKQTLSSVALLLNQIETTKDLSLIDSIEAIQLSVISYNSGDCQGCA